MNNNFEDHNKCIIKNKELRNFIQFQLDKITFEEKDLIKITDIVLDGKTITGDINIVDFNEIALFPNLKKIELKNLNISKQYVKKFETLDEIYFKNCKIESIKEINKIKKISINNCIVEDFIQIENFQNLEYLEFINIEIVDFSFLKALKNLKTLKIKNVRGFSLDKINFTLPITHFSIEGIDNLDADNLIKNNPNLKSLSIDSEKQSQFHGQLEKIIQKGIKILLNDIYEY